MLGTRFSGRRLYQEDRLGASQKDHLPHSQHSRMQCRLPGILPCHRREVCFCCLNAGWSPVQCCCTRSTLIHIPKTEHKPSAVRILASAFTTNNFPLWISASLIPRYKMYTCYSLLRTDPFFAVSKLIMPLNEGAVVVISGISSSSFVNISSTVSLKRRLFMFLWLDSYTYQQQTIGAIRWPLCATLLFRQSHTLLPQYFFPFFFSYVSWEMAHFLCGEIPLFCGPVHIWYLGKGIFFLNSEHLSLL